MIRIKIVDLPRDVKVSRDEMRKILGGIDTVPLPDRPSLFLSVRPAKKFAGPYPLITRR